MKKATRQIWDEIPIPGTVISQLNALRQGQPNDLELIDWKKRLVEQIKITGVDYWENESPHIELV